MAHWVRKIKRYKWLLLDIVMAVVFVAAVEVQMIQYNGQSFLGSILSASAEAVGLAFQQDSLAHGLSFLIIPVLGFITYVGTVLILPFRIPGLPIMYIAMRFAFLKAGKEKVTFRGSEDILYFRETFPGMSPATVSLLMDLEVEDKKDAAATLLQLYRRGVVEFNNGEIEKSPDKEFATQAEAELFFAVRKGGSKNLIYWKSLSVMEAVRQGYVQKVDPKMCKKKVNRAKRALGILFAVLMSMTFISMKTGREFMNFDEGTPIYRIDEVLSGDRDLKEYTSSPEFFEDAKLAFFALGEMIPMLCFLVLLFWVPIYSKMYKKKQAAFVRTRKGEAAAAQLKGLANFIHDFTLLDEAAKEKVVLWDDFLVYAVVLEQNEGIVQEIGQRYKAFDVPVVPKLFSMLGLPAK